MAAVKSNRRPGVQRTTGPSRAKDVANKVMDRLSSDELATVLQTLLRRHPDLRSEAESIAVELVSSTMAEDIAEDVFACVTALGADAIQGRAGKQSWGYVEPTEAAWELLEEAVDDIVADMKRRMELGLHAAAEAICCGIVIGLYKAKDVRSDGLLGWAPDFPAEEACHVVAELVQAFPTAKRGAVRDRLIEALGDLVPEWYEMIARAAARAAQEK